MFFEDLAMNTPIRVLSDTFTFMSSLFVAKVQSPPDLSSKIVTMVTDNAHLPLRLIDLKTSKQIG